MDDVTLLSLLGTRQITNHIENDEYESILTSLERWRDRDYRPINRWLEANDTTENCHG